MSIIVIRSYIYAAEKYNCKHAQTHYFRGFASYKDDNNADGKLQTR